MTSAPRVEEPGQEEDIAEILVEDQDTPPEQARAVAAPLAQGAGAPKRKPREPILDPWSDDAEAAAPPRPPQETMTPSGDTYLVARRSPSTPQVGDDDEVITSAAPLDLTLKRKPISGRPPGPPSPPARPRPPTHPGSAPPGHLGSAAAAIPAKKSALAASGNDEPEPLPIAEEPPPVSTPDGTVVVELSDSDLETQAPPSSPLDRSPPAPQQDDGRRAAAGPGVSRPAADGTKEPARPQPELARPAPTPGAETRSASTPEVDAADVDASDEEVLDDADIALDEEPAEPLPPRAAAADRLAPAGALRESAGAPPEPTAMGLPGPDAGRRLDLLDAPAAPAAAQQASAAPDPAPALAARPAPALADDLAPQPASAPAPELLETPAAHAAAAHDAAAHAAAAHDAAAHAAAAHDAAAHAAAAHDAAAHDAVGAEALTGRELEHIEAFADLPEGMHDELARAAHVGNLAPDEELAVYGAALVLTGSASVCANIVDTPAERAATRTLVPSRGTLQEGIPLRVVAGAGGARVAIWDQTTIDNALRTCPWVVDELRGVADRLQALAGATMGPLGELEEPLLRRVLGRLRLRVLEPGEQLIHAGNPMPGLVIIGAGALDLIEERSRQSAGAARPGELLFASELLAGQPAPSIARAATGGALVLVADHPTLRELFESTPEMLSILAQAVSMHA
ncbi:cyclic nucleotide-binding domain-containing protein [Sorangium sp. So ce1036]|uniref:hypothetical protein n=1 Tax=Sorangium sp. So ce1036 TaxID=3133328 RepID=UPI003F0ECBAC